MSEERLKLAIGRLENALSRAESNRDAIVQTLNSYAVRETAHLDENHRDLEKKYELLKKQVAETVSAIESLIPVRGQN